MSVTNITLPILTKSYSARLRSFFLTHGHRTILMLILCFAGATRLFNLGQPSQDYFDEIYHAFTARLILHNDPKPWEFWNENPEGHAYEWSHPPFAKLAMALSMKLFGQTAFAWRLPSAILGTLVILMIYLITQLFFKNTAIALLAAALASLDGLLLTMSRIGKDDIYIPFFILLTIYLFCQDRYFWSSVTFGIALATKWNTILLLPLLPLIHFVFDKKLTHRYFWFLLMPPLLYTGSYVLLFLTGHTFKHFLELQKVMFNFHCNVGNTHHCGSPAWSWPFNYKPVYLFWNNITGDGIAMIYAMGNPLLFWTGIICILGALYYALQEKNKFLGLLVFAYFLVFVPWIFSPREMFLYLYLPSVTFMISATAYMLYRFQIWKYFLFGCLVLFIYFYPHWTAIPIPHWLHKTYFWFAGWR